MKQVTIEHIEKLLREDETLTADVIQILTEAKADLEEPYVPATDNFEKRMAIAEALIAAIGLGVQIYYHT